MSSRTNIDARPELPPRIQRHAADRDSRDAAAVKKLKSFFEAKACLDITSSRCQMHDHTKVVLDRKGMHLFVRHRGTELSISYPSMEPMDALETEFRDWCKKNMNHVKVFPRKS